MTCDLYLQPVTCRLWQVPKEVSTRVIQFYSYLWQCRYAKPEEEELLADRSV